MMNSSSKKIIRKHEGGGGANRAKRREGRRPLGARPCHREPVPPRCYHHKPRALLLPANSAPPQAAALSRVAGGRPCRLDELRREHILRLRVEELRLPLEVPVDHDARRRVEAVLRLQLPALWERGWGETERGARIIASRPSCEGRWGKRAEEESRARCWAGARRGKEPHAPWCASRASWRGPCWRAPSRAQPPTGRTS